MNAQGRLNPEKRQMVTIKVEAKGKGKDANKSMRDVSRPNNDPFFDFTATNDPPTILWIWPCGASVYSAYCC